MNGWPSRCRLPATTLPLTAPRRIDKTDRERMADSAQRIHLRRELEVHISQLGYSCVHTAGSEIPVPEIVRISPIRGRIAYGETVLRTDLERKRCHERLRFFSQRRTRHRSSILFFVGVSTRDQHELEDLLKQLDIRSGLRGGHVHVVPIAASKGPRRRAAGAPRTARR